VRRLPNGGNPGANPVRKWEIQTVSGAKVGMLSASGSGGKTENAGNRVIMRISGQVYIMAIIGRNL